MDRKTKIIATLGPAVASAELVSDLVGAGIDVARLNFSHGSYDFHRQFTDWVRQAADEHDRAVAVMQDVQGPRIRVGTFPGGGVALESGELVTLRPGAGEAVAGEVYVDQLGAAEDLAKGSRVSMADGLVRLEVNRVDGSKVHATVVEGGVLSDHKGVAFPDNTLALPPVTEKDEHDLEFGGEIGVDIVGASFVGSGDDVRVVRKLAGGVPIIAKIERTVAYEALDDILAEADGAMVARGDLGVELLLQRLPLVQKDILRRTNMAGRLSITATEMLESMTTSPRPTRAEVTDVANAVLDGTDAVMLSGETAVGQFPVRAVETMDKICREIEAESSQWMRGVDFLEREAPFPSAVARAGVQAANSLGLAAIVAFTESGTTARLITKYRPEARIVTFTPKPETYRRMALFWGVTPLMIGRLDSTDEMIHAAERLCLEHGIVREGDAVAMVAGVPPNQSASTNLIKLHVIGAETKGVPGGSHD